MALEQWKLSIGDENTIDSDRLVASNELILGKVFKFLNLDDIKNCRLVNICWMDCAQPFFKDRTTLKIYYGKKDPNKTSRNFLTDFKHAPFHFEFTNLSIEFGSKRDPKSKTSMNDQDVVDFDRQYDDPMLELLPKCGRGLKFLKLMVMCGKSMEQFLLPLKKILSTDVPQLEHLCLDLYVIVTEYNARELDDLCQEVALQKSADFKLNKLRKFEYFISLNWTGLRFSCDKFYSFVLQDLMNSAPNLNCVVTEASELTSLVFRPDSNGLVDETVSGLKEITLRQSHVLGDKFSHKVFVQLNALSQKNLRLTTFNIAKAKNGMYHRSTSQREFYEMIYAILIIQKDTLENLFLNFGLEALGRVRSPADHYPHFPIMPKLKNFKITDSWLLYVLASREANPQNRVNLLNDYLPNLEAFELEYRYEYCRHLIRFKKLLKICTTNYKTLKSLTINCDCRVDPENSTTALNLENLSPELFKLAERKCPTLKTIVFRDTAAGKKTYSFFESKNK